MCLSITFDYFLLAVLIIFGLINRIAMHTPFHFVIDTKEELMMQRRYYADMLNEANEKKKRILNELNELEIASANCKKMLNRIDDHLIGKQGELVGQQTDSIPSYSSETPEVKLAEPSKPKSASLFEEAGFTVNTAASTIGTQSDSYLPNQIKAVKAEYALKKIGKDATTREMLTILLNRDPDLLKRDQTTFDKYQKALSATLVQKADAKKTFYNIKTNEGVKYGLISWRNK